LFKYAKSIYKYNVKVIALVKFCFMILYPYDSFFAKLALSYIRIADQKNKKNARKTTGRFFFNL